ncbi:hypothetical protein [Bacteroides pyogenes]|uniref:hypothetical protein n=1 Tax=Bacteroides pyogenes TaxID=310300 RepID=UPI001BAC9447|nr:hypothetical protein [Bacteroides pyogenes]
MGKIIKIMKPIDKCRYVAYDAANNEYYTFETLEEAKDWLKKDDSEWISEEACLGWNFIAEIQYRSVVTVTDQKSNYHTHTEDCPDDCDEEEWPYSDDVEWVGKHSYEKIEW